jgi:hypothetical protein
VKPMWAAGCVGIFATLCLAVGCTTEAVGQTCSTERDCPDGTRCYRPDGSAASLCTVRCDGTPCSEGQCQQTDRGSLCLKQCRSQRDCGEETRCDRGDQSRVCWPVKDSHIHEVPQGPMIDRAEIWTVKNAGYMHPNEQVYSIQPSTKYIVDIFVINNGLSSETVYLSELSVGGACMRGANQHAALRNMATYRHFSPSSSCDTHLSDFNRPTSSGNPEAWSLEPGKETLTVGYYNGTPPRPFLTMLIEMPAETSASEAVVTLGLGRVGSSGTMWSSSIGLEVKNP